MRAQANRFAYSARLGLVLALVAAALSVVAATVAWAHPGNPDPNPDPGAHSAPVTTTVSITYDEPISAATVTSRTFAVHGKQTGLVTELSPPYRWAFRPSGKAGFSSASA